MPRILIVVVLILSLYDTVRAENFCQSHKPPTSGPREGRMRAKAVYAALCEASDESWWLDVETATEQEKFAHATACLMSRPAVDDDVATFIAWCADDAATFDENKGMAMLKQLGLDRTRAATSWSSAAAWQKKTNQLANDPRWRPILEAAAQGRAGWHASVDADRELFAQASELAAKAEPGCTVKASDLMAQYLAKQKPKTLDALRAALETPVGFRLYWTMYECAGIDADGPETHVMYYAPPRWQGTSADELRIDPARGPRAAAALAVDLALEKSSDRKLSRLRVRTTGGLDRDMRREPEWLTNKTVHYEQAAGTIAAIKPEKDGKVLLTFKTETLVHDVGTCKSTREIARINSDGTVEYVQDCHVSGQEKERVTPHAVRIGKPWAAKLKVGKMISYFYQSAASDKEASDGAVSLIWTDAKRTALSGWAGLGW
jgi:hypothetical protein